MRRSPCGPGCGDMGSSSRLRTDHPRRGRMRRRVVLSIVVAILALMMALVGGPAALAATKRLPIKSGPNGVSRTPGAITRKIVGGTPVPNGKYPFQAALRAQSFGTDERFKALVALSAGWDGVSLLGGRGRPRSEEQGRGAGSPAAQLAP